jgi:hypothetical protein
VETNVTNKDGTASKVNVPASYTVYFGHEFEVVEEDTAETTVDSDNKEEKPSVRFFFTQSGSSVVYSADKELADNIFEYLSYVPPVETETTAE